MRSGLSINKNRELLVFNSDWNSKKLFVDEKFEEETLFKAMKILKNQKLEILLLILVLILEVYVYQLFFTKRIF